MKLSRLERLGAVILVLISIISIWVGFANTDYFDLHYAEEDGAVETGTAIMLFAISMLSLYRLIKLGKYKSVAWKFGLIVCVIVFFFATGEEISWGQRIFGIQSSGFFKENNAQGETNLHNLVIDHVKVNKLIFSQLLMVFMVPYLLAAPIMYRKLAWFKSLVNKFAVPIVQWQHTLAFILTTLAVISIPASRKWEVYELLFGFIFFFIFLNPMNDSIYKKTKKQII